LIIADAECPKSRFLSFVEDIHTRFPAIPIVLVSSTGKVLLPEDAIRNGVYGYLHKPVSLAELELMLVRIDETKKQSLKRKRKSDQ
jgi:DNA-binding NtrC family response regulator